MHITTPQHIRSLFYIQTAQIFHLCNKHFRLSAELSADKTLLTSVESRQQKACPSLAQSPLQLCMRTPLPGARGTSQPVCPPQSVCFLLLMLLLKWSLICSHPVGLGSTTCRKFFLSLAFCLSLNCRNTNLEEEITPIICGEMAFKCSLIETLYSLL